MNINQLKYVLEVAASSSMREASTKLYVSQPALSASIHDLEEELGILIFERNNKGISLTDEGRELLSYAKKAVQQYEILEDRYLARESGKERFSVSTQHYNFAIKAFTGVIRQTDPDKYTFSIHETKTKEVLEDVRSMKSEVGIVSFSGSNEALVKKAALLTVEIVIIGIAAAVIIGLICEMIIYFKIPVLRRIVSVYIEVSRNTPLLIQLFFIYYGFPKIVIRTDAKVCGAIGLAFLGGSYMAEAFRSGVEAIDTIQEESAYSLGVDINFVSTEAANRVEYLETGKVDIILANFTVTDERAQKVDFALPYMNVSLGVVSPDRRVITDLSQLGANDEVIVISGTTAEDYLIKNYSNIAEKRKIAFLSASDHVSADSLDSEHLNEEGHRILASVIYDKLRETKMI